MSRVENKKVGVHEILAEEPQISLLFEPESKRSEEKNESINKNTLNVLSLFSGCGGMDLGFEGNFTTLSKSINEKLTPHFIEKKIGRDIVLLKKNKFKTVFANDILQCARNAWISYFSKKRNISAEIFRTDSIVDLVKLHKKGVQVFPQNVDIVTGGFPCQDFSVAGKRNGFNSNKNHKGEAIKAGVATEETRGKLYMWMKHVIEITEPNIFIAENVKGLANLSNVKEIIQQDFSNAYGNGYIVLEPQILHAADYGIPQSRERVIFIGIKKSELTKLAFQELNKEIVSDEYSPYPTPTHSFTLAGKHLKKAVQLKDVFKRLKEPEITKDLSQKFYSRAKFMGAHCQGQTEINPYGISPTIRAEHHGNIEFRRLSKKNGGRIFEEIGKGLKERRLTLRECAMIQTFPLDYDFVIENKEGRKGEFLVSPSHAYKIIGNAVPPLLAYHIAKRIEQVWDLYFKKPE